MGAACLPNQAFWDRAIPACRNSPRLYSLRLDAPLAGHLKSKLTELR